MKSGLILVSKSPRRHTLLKEAGFEFEVAQSLTKEKDLKTFDIEILKEISRTTALSVSGKSPLNSILISADTVVVLDNKCLGKPKDENEAFQMLKDLSNRFHSVYTSITIINNKTKQELTEVLETKVYFRELTDSEIIRYIKDFNPLDKAGAYGIQDFVEEDEINSPPPKSFIQKIEGDYENVMGISTKLLKNMLNKI